MKILILVLSKEDGSVYSSFKKTQKETWDSIELENVKTLYYIGDSNTNELIGNEVYTDVKESLFNCGKKFLRCLEIIKDSCFDFDFIFRTNSSSYIDKKIIYEFLLNNVTSLNFDSYYAGVNGNFNNIRFASGSGFFMSKKNVNLILDNKNSFNHSLIDDVAIGEIMQKNGINVQQTNRFDIVDDNIINIDFNNIPVDYFHYRFKTYNRNNDINNMRLIHKLKYGKNKN